MIVLETYANQKYRQFKDGSFHIEKEDTTSSSLLSSLFAVFLPTGFPQSVKPDYLPYQIYDSFQALFSTLTGILATKELLKGIGVGDASGNASQATLTYILKDGLSMITRIGFAYQFAPKFMENVKSWRFMADVLNDLGYMLEFVAVTVPRSYFIWVASAAGMLKCCVGVCGGASRMSLTMHFALQHNESDLNAKDGSQETLINLCGMFLGWFMMKQLEKIQETQYLVFSLYLIFTFFHLLFNYLAVSAVQLDSLNEQRCCIIMKEWGRIKKVPSPAEVSRKEAILQPIFQRKKVHVGNPLTKEVIQELDKWHDQTVIIRVGEGFCPRIYLHQNAEDKDILLAYLACILHSVGDKSDSVEDCQAMLQESGILDKLSRAGYQLHLDSLGIQPFRFATKL